MSLVARQHILYHAEVDCGSPRKPRYGAVQFSFTFYEWTVMFQCNFGYIMEGAASAVCNESGHWSRNPPTCRGICLNCGVDIIVLTVCCYCTF